MRLDEGVRPVELPSLGRLGVLLVLGGHPAKKREVHDVIPWVYRYGSVEICGGTDIPCCVAAFRRIRRSARAPASVIAGAAAGVMMATPSSITLPVDDELLV